MRCGTALEMERQICYNSKKLRKEALCHENFNYRLRSLRRRDRQPGYQPVDVPIREDGETAYFTSLPVKAMVQRMRDAGIPAAVSYTAGTYVCNYLLYTLLYLIDKKYPNVRGGFIHVPYAMEQVINKPLGTPSMDLRQIARGLETAVEAVAACG